MVLPPRLAVQTWGAERAGGRGYRWARRRWVDTFSSVIEAFTPYMAPGGIFESCAKVQVAPTAVATSLQTSVTNVFHAAVIEFAKAVVRTRPSTAIPLCGNGWQNVRP